MSNRYHWVLKTPQANLVAGMRWFQNAVTRRFNLRHLQWGHLFGERYKAVVIDEAEDYLARPGKPFTRPRCRARGIGLMAADFVVSH